ncbi:hypothetical protein SDC9_159144 [bioreactor metagenome]|uniref:Uncharacterized protein n=1 Tax=bioreactor metagenome TaxID=1076179 RepID=A0A645FE13_9ZZZZ
MCDISNTSVQYKPRTIHDRNLTAGSVTGVKSQSNFPFHGRLEQQLLEVHRKRFNGAFGRFFGQHGTDFTLNRRFNQSVISIRAGKSYCFREL